MKSIKLFGAMLVVSLCARMASAQFTTNSFMFNVNQLIPDGSPVGLTLTTNVAGISGAMSDVTLTLDITGGFNGDLYAYLAGPNGGLAILLNRVGVSGSSSFGYSDAGFNITLSDAALNGNIHSYQTVGGYAGLLNGGDWIPDGRNVDPLSPGGVIAGTATTSDFSLFSGANANGTWTFFVSDLSGGGSGSLNSVVLNITTVPEPSAFQLIGISLLGFLAIRRRRVF